jgi:hypothetical protein
MGSVTGKGNMPAPAMLAQSPGTGARMAQRPGMTPAAAGAGGAGNIAQRMAQASPGRGALGLPGGAGPAAQPQAPMAAPRGMPGPARGEMRTPPMMTRPNLGGPGMGQGSPTQPGPRMPMMPARPGAPGAGGPTVSPIGGPGSPNFAGASGQANSFGPSDPPETGQGLSRPGDQGGEVMSDADRPTMGDEARNRSRSSSRSSGRSRGRGDAPWAGGKTTMYAPGASSNKATEGELEAKYTDAPNRTIKDVLAGRSPYASAATDRSRAGQWGTWSGKVQQEGSLQPPPGVAVPKNWGAPGKPEIGRPTVDVSVPMRSEDSGSSFRGHPNRTDAAAFAPGPIGDKAAAPGLAQYSGKFTPGQRPEGIRDDEISQLLPQYQHTAARQPPAPAARNPNVPDAVRGPGGMPLPRPATDMGPGGGRYTPPQPTPRAPPALVATPPARPGNAPPPPMTPGPPPGLPEATRFAVLANPNNPLVNDSIVTDSRAAVSSIGGHIEVLSASSNSEIDAAFANLTGQRCQALLVSPGPLFGNRRIHIAMLAMRYAMPAMYYDREFTEIGGLISYGTSLVDQYRQTGIYTGRVLRGERPTDLPVQRATKFELVINVQTAKTLGLTIPPTLLARADAVIE